MTLLSWASKPLPTPGVGRPDTDRDGRLPAEDLATVVGPLVGLMARASRRILHDDDLADDAIQETLLTYWNRAEQPANPRAWLLHAVTLRSLHLARSSRRRREHERRATAGRAEWSWQDDPARSLDHGELIEVLHRALDRLPAEYRVVFLLSTFDEMDYATIAQTLQIPIGTVRSRLNRTRRLIREALTRTHVEPDLPTVAGPARSG